MKLKESTKMLGKAPHFNLYLIPFFFAFIKEGFNQWHVEICQHSPLCAHFSKFPFACAMTALCYTHHSFVHLYTCLASLYDDGESAISSPSKDGPEAEAGPVL